jgi:hypothetical protein
MPWHARFESLSISERSMTSLQAFIPICRNGLLAFLVVSGPCAQAQPRVADSLSPFASASGEHQNDAQGGTRIFGIVPSHNTLLNRSMVAPLRTPEKFRLAGADSFDQSASVLAGIYAGLGQWQHQYPEFGLGAAGLAKRYATAYGDQVIGNYMNEAIFPTMLHQDPRYYRMAHGGFIQRTTYAVSRVLITRSDSGAGQFNFSQAAGTASAAAIANLYYPDRTFSSTMQRFGIQLASGGVFNILKEYWPNIRQRFPFRRRIEASKHLNETRDVAPANRDNRDKRAAVAPEPFVR